MIRVAMLSFWHVHAKDYAKQATDHPDTEIVAIWDELPERGRREADQRGLRWYESLDELLQQSDIDAVIVDAPTNIHHEVMIKAANAGKHIFTEKVIAPTTKEVQAIVDAVRSNGVKLTVSLPRVYHGYTLAIQEVLEQGLLGQVSFVRTRLAHNGSTAGWLPEHFFSLEQCGGGALIDLGCHPMYLARLFLGMPSQVTAHFGYISGKEVEDNAVAVLQNEQGGIAIVEAGFVTSFAPFTIEVQGTEGSLSYSDADKKLVLRSSKLGEEASKTWSERSIPEDNPTAYHQWVSHILNGTEATDNIQLALELTMLMEAAYLSVERKTAVRIEELTH
ncbi:MAG: Gfo/Idh/MocA family oxidoreductase [Paenibacillus sp.]|nr:Gfo/Idh/MocA family oxidoreductase [Paenibacillus sp.]